MTSARVGQFLRSLKLTVGMNYFSRARSRSASGLLGHGALHLLGQIDMLELD